MRTTRNAEPIAPSIRPGGRGTDRKPARPLALLLAIVVSACDSGSKLPDASSAEYRSAVAAFYVGLAALQVGDDATADRKLADLTKLVPAEPAGWANWGLLALRQRNFDVAAERLGRARDLAPRNAHAQQLVGILERNRGRSADAIAALQKAVDIDPRDLRSRYALAQEIERQAGANADAQFARQIRAILDAQPDNLAALLEEARAAARRGDAAALGSSLASIRRLAASWPPEVLEQLGAAEQAAADPAARAAPLRVTVLRNVLVRLPEYRESLAAIKAPAAEEAAPFLRFVSLPTPVYRTAAPDLAITFDVRPLPAYAGARWNWIGAIPLDSAGDPVTAVANANEVRLASGATLPFPGGAAQTPPTPEGVAQLDFDYDFKTDLVLAGAGGVRLFHQDSPARFTDVTAATRLPRAIVDAAYTGAWPIDVEADGDLDIVLGTKDDAPLLLRNNGDGTFSDTHPFPGVSGLVQFVWADLDGDGNPEAALIDGARHLRVFGNERQGVFRELAPPTNAEVEAITPLDADGDGRLDIVALTAEGALLRVSGTSDHARLTAVEIARVPNRSDLLGGDVRLRAADLDNNGGIDLYVVQVSPARAAQGGLAWLRNERGEFTLLDHAIGPPQVFDAADVDHDGKLDLLGLSADGAAVEAINRSSRGYHWQVVRPRAAQAFGDQRINPFGVGGEVEIRAGLLVQRQPITGPQIHFGLGEQTSTDVVRVLWPNGTARAEFDVKADQPIDTEQRLKGSCPFLFAWDGTRMAFVKDAVPWGSAIGLRINTIGSAAIAATEEWYRIARDELVPHDGFYDLRITAELWEVYYYDHLALMTVDHPVGTEVFVDERFVIPPVKPAITAVATPQKIARAIDDTGRDVTATLAARDGKSLDGFGVGQYQGVTRDHYVEVDLGDAVPADGPLFLVANGSLYPTDSSLNVALTQGERWHPRGLVLEVPDGRGGWVVAHDNLGFPAGRKKTMLVDLTNVFRPGTPRRVRLRTNLEIYWDSIEWARGLPDTPLRVKRLDPTVADLHFRGYSVIGTPDTRAPEVPDYDRLAGTQQRWRDLEGYYTRFGDVRELLQQTDDRYVIMNSGDELSLRFAEEAPPAPGFVRDFVIAGDGWIKDGDYNSTFSKTVQPLPHHSQRDYTEPPGRLEDEWTYRQHPDDWQTYHTRYVAPDGFRHALLGPAAP
jgi:tetratricopeptide (TPR) repeat protein